MVASMFVGCDTTNDETPSTNDSQQTPSGSTGSNDNSDSTTGGNNTTGGDDTTGDENNSGDNFQDDLIKNHIKVNGGTLADGSTEGDFSTGEKITLIAQPKDGFYFLGWFENGESISYDYESILTVEYSTEFTAEYIEICSSGELEYTLEQNAYYEVTGIGTWSGTQLIIPDTHNGKPVKSIGYQAFQGCEMVEVILPDTITQIWIGAFNSCSLQKIRLSENLTKIRSGAFSYSLIREINIPKSVTHIEYDAFNGCRQLYSITVDDENAIFYDYKNTLINKETKTLVCTAVEFEIPSDGSVEVIGERAFYSSYIADITIPNGIITIGHEAFRECTHLKNVVLPESVTIIESAAFMNCSELESITMTNVKSIGANAFSGCKELTSAELPNSLEFVMDNIFYNCSKLNFNVENNIKYYGNKTNPYLLAYEVTDNTLSEYTISAQTRVLADTFSGCKELKQIELSDNICGIGYYAFYGCEKLQTVKISKNVTRIGKSAFENCSALQSLVYTGEKENWESIDKHSDWRKGSNSFTVQCTNGDITIE